MNYMQDSKCNCFLNIFLPGTSNLAMYNVSCESVTTRSLNQSRSVEVKSGISKQGQIQEIAFNI